MYEYMAKLDRVVDGDTVDLMVDLGLETFVKTRFRLSEINAPEVRTKDLEEKEAGNKSAAWLQEVFDDPRNAEGVLIETDQDKGMYGRWLCTIYAFHGSTGIRQNVNRTMINLGLAEPYMG